MNNIETITREFKLDKNAQNIVSESLIKQGYISSLEENLNCNYLSCWNSEFTQQIDTSTGSSYELEKSSFQLNNEYLVHYIYDKNRITTDEINVAITASAVVEEHNNNINKLPIVIEDCILHEVIKKRKEKSEIVKRDSVLDKTNSLVITFVNKILDSYTDDNKAYAMLDIESQFSKLTLSTHYKSEGIDFVNFSNNILHSYKSLIDREPFALGGILTIIKYKLKNNDFLLIVLIKDKSGISVDNKLNLIEVKNLNLDSINFAARINISSWREHHTKRQSTTKYVSFLKGSSRLNIALYFKKLIDIDENSYTNPQDDTSKLIDAIIEHCKEKQNKDAIFILVRDYMLNSIANKTELSIKSISQIINTAKPEEFFNFIDENRDKYDINDTFIPVKSELKYLEKIFIKRKGLYVAISNEAIGKEKDAEFIASDLETKKSAVLVIKLSPEEESRF